MNLQKISIQNISLIENAFKTFLTVDTLTPTSSLTVKNIQNFAINQVLILGELGNNGTELVYTHASTAPTGSTITLLANTIYPHSAGTPLTIIDFNKVEFYTSLTLLGSITLLATEDIQVDCDLTVYNNTAIPNGYYFTRFKNSLLTTYSDYSDAISVLGYSMLSARSIIDNALGMINKKTSDILTDEYGYMQLNNCTMEVIRELKRWSFLQEFDFNLGQLQNGQWKVAMPLNLDDQNTNKSVYNLRFGTNSNLNWVDKEKWNEIINGVAYTTLDSNINIGDTAITLTDSSSFSDAGTVRIGANNYGYSVNDRLTGILTLEIASTTINSVDEDVFSGASYSLPEYWTTYGGNIYVYPVVGASYANRSLKIDYYKTITMINSDGDLIPFSDPTVAQYYLAWKFLLKLQNGIENAGSTAMFNQFVNQLSTMKRKETMNRTFQLRPTLNQININDDSGDTRQIRGGNFSNTGF